MKTLKLSKGLNLNKKAITKLQESQMASIKGGQNNPTDASCFMHTCGGGE